MTTAQGGAAGPDREAAAGRYRAWWRQLPAELNADMRSSLRIRSPRSLARVIVAVVWVMTLPGLALTAREAGLQALGRPLSLLAIGCCLAVVPLLVLPARSLRYLFVVLALAGPWLVFAFVLWTPEPAGRFAPTLGLTIIPLAAFMMWGRRLGVLLTLATMAAAGLMGALQLIDIESTAALLTVIANIGLMLGWAAHTTERLEYDYLTGLGNRRALEQALEKLVHRGAPRGASARQFLALLDVDGIRALNETHGRRVVDEYLHRIGVALAARLEDPALAFHLGAGEFAVVVTGPRREAVEQLAALRGFSVAGVTLCAGMAPVDDDVAIGRLIAQAQASLARAKAAGADMLDPLLLEDALVQELRQAVENGELMVLYQPIVDLASGDTVGCEALVRWNHPALGLIPPDRFIPLAEQAGLIHDVGRHVLRAACAAAATARVAGQRLEYVSVNVSALELDRPDFGDDVLDALVSAGLEARRLLLEVTESCVADGRPEVAASLARLRQHGVRVAIDDFGTGYSSLSRLGELPVDVLKIDKSFVWAAASTRDSVLTAVIGLAKAFGLATVAEGIETWDHAELLRGLGCTSGQGYLFGRPGSFDDLHLNHPGADTAADAATDVATDVAAERPAP